MQRPNFIAMVRKLCDYYERKPPSSSAVDLWLSKVERYPDECIPWMVRTITDRFEKFPPNLPNVLRGLWEEWLRDHPERFAHDDAVMRCSDAWCREHGDGLLHVWKRGEDGLVRVFVFRCKTCGGRGANYPAATAGELQEKGYELDTLQSIIARTARPKPKEQIRAEMVILMGKMKHEVDGMIHDSALTRTG